MQKPLLLNDLLHLNQSDLDRSKVKFNQYNGEIEPMEVYLRNPDDVNTTWLFWSVNGHLRIPFFGHEKSPRKGRRVYEQELCISSYLLYASLSWCMLRYVHSSFHPRRLRWLMPSRVVQGDGVFGNYHL
jgi:hypothetical protein